MKVVKNWALTIILIALAFTHFSSELLLKEQMIIPVQKRLNNAGHINTKLIDFSEICQKNPAKSAVFYWLFLGEVSPLTFPVKSADFSANLPLKIPRNFVFFSAKYQKSWKNQGGFHILANRTYDQVQCQMSIADKAEN